MMDIGTLFGGSVMALPRDRGDGDFERYVAEMFADYVDAVRKLNPTCHLGARIRQAEPEINALCRRIESAIREYLGGMPEAAYGEIAGGINSVVGRLKDLQSRRIDPGKTGRLFRVRNTGGVLKPKEELFHVPFYLRHFVSQHRYGIPGFPCLYMGGSLALCLEECRIDGADLQNVCAAEYSLRRDIQILDFGYRPQALAKVAAGRAMGKAGENPELEDFIVNYAVCWPLIAASSIRVLHDGKPFIYEYVVPQIILQWVLRNEDWDGIRYFSSRYMPDSEAIGVTANYVFPAVRGTGTAARHSQKLKDTFDMTDPVLWVPIPRGWIAAIRSFLRRLCRRKSAPEPIIGSTPLMKSVKDMEVLLGTLPRSPLT